MKPYIIFAFAIFCLAGCSTNQKTSNKRMSIAVSVMPDFTDKRLLWPTVGPILPMFDFKNNADAEAWLHVRPITDKQYNTDYVVHIPPGSVSELTNTDDPQHRNRCVVSFYDSVRQVFEDVYKRFDTTKGYGNSEIFASICGELQWLQNTHATRKTLIIFSNLLENSGIISAYTSATATNVPAIIQKFIAANVLPDHLQGFRIFIVHASLTMSEDSKYAVMVSVYKQLLESRGAIVTVQANNQNYMP